jgi:hypothetical protein
VYSATILIHSLLRWIVLLFGAAAVGQAVGGLGGRGWSDRDERVARLFVIGYDVQVLVGLILYVAVSPITTGAFSDMGAAMRNTVTRFWAVEHLFGMIVALALAHIGRARIRRAADAARKHRAALVFFGLALLITVVSTPWPFSRVPRPYWPGL